MGAGLVVEKVSLLQAELPLGVAVLSPADKAMTPQ